MTNKKYRLTKIRLDEISLVDFGADPNATVHIFKRLDPQANIKEADMPDKDMVEEMKAATATIVELNKKNAELATEIVALKKAGTDPAKAQEEIEKALPASVRDQLETLRKANEAAQKQLAEMADEREIAKAISEAKTEFGNLPVKAEEFGPVLKRAMGSLKAEDMVVLRRVLKAADQAILDSTRSVGFLNKSVSTSAEAELATISAAIVTAEKVTLAKANVMAMERNPGLYSRYLSERGAAN